MARRMAFHLPGSKGQSSKGGISGSACYYPPTYFQHHTASSSSSSAQNPSSSHGLLLRATPDSDDLLLEEISVVSANADPGHVTYGSGSLAANGPRVVPGIITNSGRGGLNERLSSSGTRLDSSSSPVRHYNSRNVDTVSSRVAGAAPSVAVPAAARQSPIDLVTCRALSGDKRYSRDSVSGGYANRSNAASSELDISRKTREARRRDIRSRLRLDKWEPPHAPAAPQHLPHSQTHAPPAQISHRGSGAGRPGAPNGCGGSGGGSSSGHIKGIGCRWSFVFDPAGRLCYYWSMVVSLAFLYNFWVLIYRFAFQEITRDSLLYWFCLDYFSDFLYLLDIAVHFRTGYLEDGVLQTDSTKLRHHYMNSTTFYIDCLCLLPLDFLYLSIGFNSILRSFRLVKIYRFWAFMDRTERHTNYPNLFRATSLIHYLLVIFHWNGCLYHIICKNNGFGSKNWVFGDSESADVVKQYLQSYYWCTLALTTIGDLPRPRSKSEYLFVISQLLFGLLLFASVLGHVANIVTNVSAARKEFQAKLDGVKTYMRMRRVPNHLQVKVIKWFDYLWLTQKCSDEEKAVSCLPDKLKAEIAINVHLDTLKRVEIFQNTEAGFLCELVLRLRPVLFSPGDFICRKGEVGKEMYIVNRGRLQVVADNGRTVLATLKAGSYFGEISILNMGTAGNRRTASVKSVGYSDLFVLSKKDMWDVLKEYPAARVRLEAIAVKRLEKYKKAPLERAAMGRSQSTPGLVESKGRIPLEEMWVSPLAPSGASSLGPPPYSANSLFSPSHSPSNRSRSGISHKALTSSPALSSSGHSSDDERRCADVTAPSSLKPSAAGKQPDLESGLASLSVYDDAEAGLVGLASGGAASSIVSDALLKEEIKRLRERLMVLETENATMSVKLSQQQWEVEHRLAEIEMQICGGSSAESSAEDNERNRESFI
ncbi:potassium/sodium hyperpolarization-activated cyclic nucleotide-gated channel 1 [Neocloeon triangulifer]|uniref:potassium/sodium hyperpolarization-activated cyclic nucleotide-gated channel 1 n=1 Tax=Neocloeon triangulifer TaxID=2078957 RepID=UPI00286FA7A3|nr:potassium/sodium hyperpolarization-activated cyclic nucleotide-gated channel 1 [Neocloeon triangulifer]